MRSFITNVVGFTGASFVAYGAWMISQPAGFITAGVFLIACGLLNALDTRPQT